jgi:hypothetical protein
MPAVPARYAPGSTSIPHYLSTLALLLFVAVVARQVMSPPPTLISPQLTLVASNHATAHCTPLSFTSLLDLFNIPRYDKPQ